LTADELPAGAGIMNGSCDNFLACTRFTSDEHGATVDLADIADRLAASHMPAATPAFEFRRWTAFLNSREQELMRLRFIEQWEYHEIAAAHALPIGTVLWKVHNAKKKLAPYLETRLNQNRKAA